MWQENVESSPFPSVNSICTDPIRTISSDALFPENAFVITCFLAVTAAQAVALLFDIYSLGISSDVFKHEVTEDKQRIFTFRTSKCPIGTDEHAVRWKDFRRHQMARIINL